MARLCEECNVSFFRLKDYKKHKRQVHSSYRCSGCREVFSKLVDLRNHKLRCQRNDYFDTSRDESAVITSKSSKCNRTSHITEKELDRQFECYLNKKFAKNRVKPNEKQCKYCCESFRVTSDFASHLRDHFEFDMPDVTGVKNKSDFMNLMGLRIKEQNIDNNSKSIPIMKECSVMIVGETCEICRKSFKCKTDIGVHIRKKHPETNNNCHDDIQVDIHITKECRVVIIGEKCKLCRMSFKCRTDVDNHTRKCHPEHMKKYHPEQQSDVLLVLKIGEEIISKIPVSKRYLQNDFYENNRTGPCDQNLEIDSKERSSFDDRESIAIEEDDMDHRPGIDLYLPDVCSEEEIDPAYHSRTDGRNGTGHNIPNLEVIAEEDTRPERDAASENEEIIHTVKLPAEKRCREDNFESIGRGKVNCKKACSDDRWNNSKTHHRVMSDGSRVREENKDVNDNATESTKTNSIREKTIIHSEVNIPPPDEEVVVDNEEFHCWTNGMEEDSYFERAAASTYQENSCENEERDYWLAKMREDGKLKLAVDNLYEELTSHQNDTISSVYTDSMMRDVFSTENDEDEVKNIPSQRKSTVDEDELKICLEEICLDLPIREKGPITTDENVREVIEIQYQDTDIQTRYDSLWDEKMRYLFKVREEDINEFYEIPTIPYSVLRSAQQERMRRQEEYHATSEIYVNNDEVFTNEMDKCRTIRYQDGRVSNDSMDRWYQKSLIKEEVVLDDCSLCTANNFHTYYI